MKLTSNQTSCKPTASAAAGDGFTMHIPSLCRDAQRMLRSVASRFVMALKPLVQARTGHQAVRVIWGPAIQRGAVALCGLAPMATALLFVALAPSAFATVVPPTVNALPATSCSAGALTSGVGTICVNNTTAYSLKALENGTQTLAAIVNGQNATYLVNNDTGNASFTLTLTATAPTNSTLAMQCSNTIVSAAVCQITGTAGTAAEGANYGPPTGGWPSKINAQLSYTNAPTGSGSAGNFDISFSNFVVDNFTGSLSGACYGSCQVANSCSGTGTTTVTGVAYMPNGVDPLPNALVYIPSAVPGAIAPGVQCLTNGNEASGGPITFTYSKYDGTFTLTGVPSGTNIPIVVQAGKWRMQGTISSITACGTTVAPAWTTTMPSTHVQGDIPKIAVVTGNVDAVECVIYRTGIAQSEFTNSSGTGQINLYLADHDPGAQINSSTPLESTLTGSSTAMNAYDMIMFPCQGSPSDSDASSDQGVVLDWANRGGRLFSTHYSYAWLQNSLNASTVTQNINGTNQVVSLDTAQGPETAVQWNTGQAQPTADPGNAIVNASFTDGGILSSWLEDTTAPAASTTPEGSPAQISISTLRLDQNGVNSPTQSWLTLTNNLTNQTGKNTESKTPVMQLTFNTPVGAGADNQCGKVLYNDYHVYNGNFSGQTFPSECPSGAMTPQEHLLEFALFDLTNAVTAVTSATAAQTFVNTPTTFTQGDSGDTIAIAVQNTSTIGLGSSLQVAGTLPTGITVNTASWTTGTGGDWSCTSSAGSTAFTCTRTTDLAVSTTDTIDVPVAVASNAPIGTGVGSLTSTISGGGLSSSVVGTDPLNVLGSHSISWATPAAITYGTALSAVQLDAAELCSSAMAAGTYAYTYGSTAVTTGTILPAGNDTLNVTFTPTTVTTSCPVLTTSVVQVVNPAPLVVTANSFTKTYGAANPTLTDAITGFVNGDTASVLTGSATLTTTATTASAVGSYPITFATETLANANYTVTYVPGTLVVTPASGVITWPSPSAINYGTALSGTQLDATATCNGSAVTGTYTYTPALGTVLASGAQTLSVTFTPTGNSNCTYVATTVPLTVNKDVLTVTAANQSMTYGGTVPTLTDAITGYVNGDTSSVVGGTATLSTTATSASPVVAGGYPITFATQALTATNYTFVYVPATLTINQAPGAITWPAPAAINYGTALSGTQLDATATCNGSAVTGTYTYTPALGTVLASGAQTLSVTFTPTGNSNCTYVATTVPLTVNKDVLTVTAANQSMTYGGTVPTLTDAITGFVNGDTSSVVGGTATLSTTATSASPVVAGGYPITFATQALTATNYTFVYVPATLTINQAPGAITWPAPAAINYGTALSGTQLDATASCNGSAVTGTYTYTPALGTVLASGAQTLSVTFTPTGNSNCTYVATTVPLTVNKDVLTVTAANQSMNYGGTVPTLTDAITGFVNGDTSSVVGGTATMATTGTSSSAAGTYPITFATTGLTASNYTFNYVPGTLTINQLGQTITFNPVTPVTYGVSPITLTATGGASGNPVTFTYVSGPGSLSGTNGSTLTVTGAGSIVVQACQAGNVDYTAATCVTKTIVVNPAVLTVTANNASMPYGGPIPTFTDTITGYVNGQNSSVVSGTATMSTTGTITSAAGTNYPITFATENLSATNYTFNYVPGTLTVNQAPGVINWPAPAAISYGTPLSGTQLDATATCNGTSVAGTYAYSPASGAVLNSGAQTLSVTFTPTGSSNCTFTPATVPLTVNKDVLTVTAANQSMTYGGTVPTLTDAITGFVNGDTSSVVSGTATLATTGTSSSAAGSYPITFATTGLTANNYTFNYVPGTLTINQGSGVINWPAPAAISYGTPLSGTQLDATATCNGTSVAGTYAYSPASGAVLNSGAQTLSVTFTPTGSSNCTFTPATVPLTVNKDVLTVTAANQSMTYGGTVPTLTDAITGFVNGDTSSVVSGTATLATTGTSSSAAGSYPITFATTGLTANNYTFNYVPGTLTINQGSGVINWPAPAAISYGTPLSGTQLDATATCNGTSVAGTYAYSPASGAVLNSGAQTLSVTFTPTGSSNCTFTPATVPLTVNKDVLTVTAANQSMTYGGTVPTLTDAITGFVNGDTSSVVSGTATLATTGTSSSAAGSYPITFATTGLTANNYTFNYVPGTLTINQGSGVINWPAPAAISYGTPLSGTQLDATATCNGTSVAGTYAYSPASGAVLNSGAQTLSVTFTPTGSSNCTFTPATVPLTVKPAVLTVTATNLTMPYAGPLPTLTDAITGFVNGDTSSVVSGTATLSTTATASSAAGTYPITFATQGLIASNYTFNYVPGTLTVSQPVAGVINWPTPAPINYGTTLGSTQYDATATCNGTPVTGTWVYTSPSGPVPPAGTQTLNATFLPPVGSACTFTPASVSIVVNKDVLTVTAANQSMSYGGTVPTLTDAITGYVNGDTSSVVSGTATLATTGTSSSAVGAYPITFATTGLTAANYTFNYVPGTLTINQGGGVINWPTPGTISYGTPLSGTQLDATATCNGVPVSGTWVYTPASGTVLIAGAQNLLAVFTPSTNNCMFSPATVVQNVNQAPLTVAAANKSMTYGATVPTLTDAITGFVNGDTSSVVSGTATMATTGTSSSAAGSYPITFSFQGLSASNYFFVYVPGTLTINQGSGVINWPAPAAINYGTPLSGTQLDATATCNGATVAGTYVYSPASGAVLNSGAQTLSVTFTPTGSSNCTFTPATVPLTVNKDVLTVTAANQSMYQGGTVPTLTDAITGFVNGDTASVVSGTATMATTGTSSSAAGTYPITFATTGLTAANYTFNYVPGTLTINPGLSVACAAVNTGEVGVAFNSGAMTVTGGKTPYVYSIVGTLPAGLILNSSTGAITGTPTAAGTFTVKVTDANGSSNTACAITINTAPWFACPVLVTGQAGVAYDSGAMTVGGGMAPYTFSIVGTLPSGLSLNTATGEVKGIATAAGSFQVKLTDKNGVTALSCTITINPPAIGACTLGVANAYNLISLTGNISDSADITGRIAAAGQVTQGAPIGDALRTSDPYYLLAKANGGPYAIVAGGGIATSNSFNINAGGNVYSSTSTNANFNFANENYSGSLYTGSTLVTGGTSPIDFTALQTQMYNLSGELSGLTANGVVCSVNNSGAIVAGGGCPANPVYFNPSSQHYNPSWIVLYGTSATTNVFNITQAQFENNNNLDIEVPTGSTTIINVAGASDKLQREIYFQGSTVTDANAAGILFNFATATSVTINGQLDATVLAPYAALTGGSQMGGVFIAASIGSTGEVHYDPFGGALMCSNPPAALSVTCAAVTTGTVGAAFNSGSVTVSGGTAPYAYSIVGALPAGLTLNTSTGAITGTPTASGTFQVKVTDSKGATGTTCAITINPAQAQAPKFSLAAGNCIGTQSVTITDATPGVTIYYTIDGTTPTTNSTKYAGAIKISTTETLRAIAIKTGYANSAVTTATYTFAPIAAGAPKFSLAAGNYKGAQTVTITDATAGVTIYYTTNGTTPTASSTKYTGPVKVSVSETLEAIAIAPGYSNSAVTSAKYTIK